MLKKINEVHLIWGNFYRRRFLSDKYSAKLANQLNLKVTLCTNDQNEGYYTGMVTDYIKKPLVTLANMKFMLVVTQQ